MSDSIETGVVHTGDCLDVLDELPENSVHMAMTSPPYFGSIIGWQDIMQTWLNATTRDASPGGDCHQKHNLNKANTGVGKNRIGIRSGFNASTSAKAVHALKSLRTLIAHLETSTISSKNTTLNGGQLAKLAQSNIGWLRVKKMECTGRLAKTTPTGKAASLQSGKPSIQRKSGLMPVKQFGTETTQSANGAIPTATTTTESFISTISFRLKLKNCATTLTISSYSARNATSGCIVPKTPRASSWRYSHKRGVV